MYYNVYIQLLHASDGVGLICTNAFVEVCPLILNLLLLQIRVNIRSGNGLLPDGTKPLPESMLTDHQWGLMEFDGGSFTETFPDITYNKVSENYTSENIAVSPRGQWVNVIRTQEEHTVLIKGDTVIINHWVFNRAHHFILLSSILVSQGADPS